VVAADVDTATASLVGVVEGTSSNNELVGDVAASCVCVSSGLGFFVCGGYTGPPGAGAGLNFT